jgi:hypothetical protein
MFIGFDVYSVGRIKYPVNGQALKSKIYLN